MYRFLNLQQGTQPSPAWIIYIYIVYKHQPPRWVFLSSAHVSGFEPPILIAKRDSRRLEIGLEPTCFIFLNMIIYDMDWYGPMVII